MNLDPSVIQELAAVAKQYEIKKIVLFGSRARGDNHKQSDIDLAVWGIHHAARYLDFQEAVEEQVATLLRFDLVDMEGLFVSDALREEIQKVGVVIYEKILSDEAAVCVALCLLG